MLHSAIANLLRNALKYTAVRQPRCVVSLRDSGRHGGRSRSQTACGGITATNWATLFEPYARGDDVAARQRDGLGLGLAIAEQAAEAHGGTLSVRNVTATGCVFELRVPRAAPSGAP